MFGKIISMKKTFVISILLVPVFLFGVGAFSVQADQGDLFEECLSGSTCNDSAHVCDSNNKCVFGLPDDLSGPAELLSLITRITNWVFAFFLALSFFFLFWAAFDFVMGQAEPEKMSSARKKLMYSAIGITIALLSNGFDDVLRSILGAV